MSTPSFEPREFTAGETLIWKRSLADYKPADGWTLTYYFRSKDGAGFNQLASNDGTGGFKITVAATVTAALVVGKYVWQAWVEKSGEKFLADSGEAIVKAGFSALAASAQIDTRSKNQKILDAIDATIERRATSDQMSYQIGNRSLSRMAPAELLEWRKYYAQLVAAEKRREKIRQGAPFLKEIKARFTSD